ncbi:MAG: energy transducer TonB [Alphaproteobacteria bacterium]|nr:energy transducer TonB [Alphaproteobacteria bacterium]
MSLFFLLAIAAAPAVAPPVPKAAYQRLVSLDDYPAAARAQGLAGTVRFTLQVAPTGRVTACVIRASSGTALLDAATCRLLSSRARFHPARDARGRPTAGSANGQLTWSLPR